MNDTTTQKAHTIGDPGRHVTDSQGNVDWYDTITLCLERADAMIDLAIGYERGDKKPGIRSLTMVGVLETTQQELDDIRHVLHQWRDAGQPGERERDAITPAELPAHMRHETPEKLQELFDDASMVVQSQYSMMRQIGSGDVAPPEGGCINAETARNIGATGHKAWMAMDSAFCGMIELHKDMQEQGAKP